LLPRPPLSSPLFPYTTLFRSEDHALLLRVGPGRDEADTTPVVDVVGAVEARRPLVEEQERAQRGHRSVVQIRRAQPDAVERHAGDRKSTRLNSSHVSISYAVF